MIKSVFQKIGSFLKVLGTMILIFVLKNKIATMVVALVLALAIILGITVPAAIKTAKNTSSQVSNISENTSSVVSEISSETPSSSEVSSLVTTTSKAPTTSAPTTSTAPVTPNAPATNQAWEVKYNSNLDIEDNVFMDSMVYTGYNLAKHRADGRMWTYILASRKRGMGYLSNISYGSGSTGYETSGGKPDLKSFERGGMVCASYVTYVYFNYLPNVAGIDTSALPKPVDSKLASDWYNAARKWVSLGYSKEIPFTATKNSSNYIVFKPQESIPIGSIVIFSTVRKDGSVHWERRSHVAIYGGYKNGYNWIYHVGNENGPEMCAIERVLYGPDPQWPYAVITPPSNIRMAAKLSVDVKDENGTPIPDIEITAKNQKTKATVSLGKTNAEGVAEKEGLNYGNYVISYNIPEGYTATASETAIELTTNNNSQNTVSIKFAKKAKEITSNDSLATQ